MHFIIRSSGPLRASCGILIRMRDKTNAAERSHQEIADAYLAEAKGPKPKWGWATVHVMDLSFEDQWDDVWKILLALVRRDEIIDTARLAYISAGPLEDLVCKAGPEYIDRVEHEAKFNRQFGKLLTGVWLRGAEPEVRERVVKFCRAFSDPIDGEYRY